MQVLDGKTKDLVAENVQELKKIFPEIFTEGKIDIEKLLLVLGENIEKSQERYEFTWNGKTQAIKLAQKQSTGTLRPAKEESKNWETTKNLYIEGDNLEVLRLLQKAYHKKVKMIYIDPPYNTGNDFVYRDDFRDNIKNYKEITGQTMRSNAETSGRYHTDWLNMMYPRLKLAKNFLSDDGVIFVSIDEHEIANLRPLLSEIFGEENWIADLVWQGSSKNDEQFFAICHEYILVYAKNRDSLGMNGKWEEPKEGILDIYEASEQIKTKYPNDYEKQTLELKAWYSSLPTNHPAKEHSHYSWVDHRGIYFAGDLSGPRFGQYRYDVIHPKTGRVCKEPTRGWVYPEKVMKEKIAEELVHFGVDETTVPCRKTYLKDHETMRPRTVIYKDGRAASGVVSNLFGAPKIFPNPKDHEILSKLIEMATGEDDIIMDFFAGSCSTAHAILQLNSDGGNRRMILVQLPEPTSEDSEAYKAGYSNICEIGKERIRRAGEKIVSDTGKTDLDIGFKVFKLDSSNLKAWDSETDDIIGDILDLTNPIKEDRSQEDVLYEIMLKYGIDLTMPIEEIEIKGKRVASVGLGYMLVCLENNLTLDVIEEIAKMKPSRAVFSDSGFLDDNVKTNAVQILKKYGVEDFRAI
jgi:adenine-specific DNA-methyltransferase